MPEMFRFRDRLPRAGEGKQPRAELAVTVEEKTAQIYLYDVIDSWGGYWGISAAEFAEALTTMPTDVERILVRINSPGGEVFEAVAIKNLLAGNGVPWTAIVDGLAASAASFIAAAADETVMGENTEMMIHDATVIARGNAEGFRSIAEDLDRVSDNIASIYAKKSGTALADWREIMKAEKWYGAQDAVDAGLADRVGQVDSTTNSTPARQLHAVALDVVCGKAAAHWTPGGVAAAAATSTTPTTETARHQKDTGPSGSAETGATRPAVTQPIATSLKENVMPRMSIEEREARITEIDARLTDIDAANSGDALPTNDQEEWDNLLAEKTEHSSAVVAQRSRQQVLEAAAANPLANESAESTEVRAASLSRSAPAVHIKPENIYDMAGIRAKARSMDDLGKLYRDHAMRAVEVAKFPSSDREEAQGRVAKMIDRFADEKDATLAQRVLTTGSPVYDRAFGKAVMQQSTGGLNPDELKALTLGSDADGGFAVPFELDPTVILTSNGSENPIRQLARVVQITGKKWEGLTSAGITVTRKGETDEATNDAPTFGQPVVDTSRADGFVPFSIALEASWTALRDELTLMLGEAKIDEEAASFITGAGTALTTGGTLPQGILTALSATTTTYVVTGSTGAMSLADLRKLKSALPERFRGNTQWLGADTFYDQADSLITQTTREDIAQATGDVLLSKPKYQASSMPDFATTSNANLAIYGNIARAFLIVDRIGMNVELIPHLMGSNGRPTGQRGIFAYWFNGSKVINSNAARLLRMK